jgi:enterobactin synthetase component D
MMKNTANGLAEFICLDPADKRLYPAVFMSASFNPKQFNDAFFSQAGIHLPDNINKASNKRKAEFFSGRYLAAQAMKHYDIAPFNLLADDNRCPLWPAEFTGSISHTAGFAACALAPKNQLSAIGIDCQEVLPTARAERLRPKIIDDNELQITRLAGLELNDALTLCFSAKESIYKALYPFIQKFFGFSAAKLQVVDLEQQCLEFHFSAQLANSIGLKQSLLVSYSRDDNRVLSHIAIASEQLYPLPT